MMPSNRVISFTIAVICIAVLCLMFAGQFMTVADASVNTKTLNRRVLGQMFASGDNGGMCAQEHVWSAENPLPTCIATW